MSIPAGWRKERPGSYISPGGLWRIVNARAEGGPDFRDVWLIEEDNDGSGNWAEVFSLRSFATLHEAHEFLTQFLNAGRPER